VEELDDVVLWALHEPTFAAADEVVEAASETLLSCDAGVRHTVEALSDAVCLLTVAGVHSQADEASV
jgi:hypothetical protein